MRPAHPLRRLRRGGAFAVLAIVLTAGGLSLGQCRLVDENLTGVPLEGVRAATCVVACNQAFNDSVRVESALHVANVHACASDSICLALEEMRHEAEIQRLQAARQACVGDCHHQGGGGGGR